MKTSSVVVLVFATALCACAADEEGADDTGECEAPQRVFPDADGDGFGDAAGAQERCDVPAGFVTRDGDCDDTAAGVHPGAAEVCDAVDNDCDGKLDDADDSLDLASADTFYRDSDGDGFGDAAMTKAACVQPAGYAAIGSDCNDGDDKIHPGATEVCDFVDNDCDAQIDGADASLDLSTAKAFYRDADGDNVGAGMALVACVAPTGYVLASGDCNDNDSASYPGGMEICDGADNDCDGGIDGTAAQPNRCAGFVGTYSGSYSHLTQEKLGTTVINSMSCTGSGSASLVLGRKPGIQGTFTCAYGGGLTLFSQNQRVTISANVGLDGAVKGTVEHTYNTFDNLKRTYNVTGTQTATGLQLTGMGSWLPNPQSAVAWTVNFSVSATK